MFIFENKNTVLASFNRVALFVEMMLKYYYSICHQSSAIMEY